MQNFPALNTLSVRATSGLSVFALISLFQRCLHIQPEGDLLKCCSRRCISVQLCYLGRRRGWRKGRRDREDEWNGKYMLQRLGHIDQHAVCALPAVPLTTVKHCLLALHSTLNNVTHWGTVALHSTLNMGACCPTQYLEQRNTLGACCLTQYLEHGGLLPYTVP